MTSISHIPGYPVDLPHIEQELMKFWQQIASTESNHAVIRSTTLNLILLVQSNEQFKEAQNLVPHIIEHHPSRIILLYFDPDNKSEHIESTISAFCQPPRSGGRQICCEQIILYTGPESCGHIRGAVLPLLIPDLPSFLATLDSDLLQACEIKPLLQIPDRLILNLPRFVDQQKDLLPLLQLIREHTPHTAISDLLWAELTPWREAAAQCFDAPEAIEKLNHIKKIKIESYGKHRSIPALLFTAWLASRLQWPSVKKDPENSYVFQDIKVSHTLRSGKPDGALARVSFAFDQDKPEMYCEIERGEPGKLVIRDPLGEKTLDIDTEPGKLLCDELDFLHADSVFLESIEWFAKFGEFE
ncbi:MAG: glucose-6-phosphate dehydrogenase assembly protein OpcA [candidate division KSB1 bacterium]|nr:glucose-6-phosphate dehydrogenase assembly protein OpcA [candidate division KSB1 bacterium]